MGLGRLCHFVLENAKSKSPHQKIFICCSYEYLDQYLLENICLIESTFNKGKVLFVTGVHGSGSKDDEGNSGGGSQQAGKFSYGHGQKYGTRAYLLNEKGDRQLLHSKF